MTKSIGLDQLRFWEGQSLAALNVGTIPRCTVLGEDGGGLLEARIPPFRPQVHNLIFFMPHAGLDSPSSGGLSPVLHKRVNAFQQP
jgi:hypothetical protein